MLPNKFSTATILMCIIDCFENNFSDSFKNGMVFDRYNYE